MNAASNVISNSASCAEDVSSNPPPHVQRCIEELRSLGVTVSRHKLYKEIVKAYSPKLRKKRCIGLPIDQYDDMVTYKTRLGELELNLYIPSLLGDSLRYLEDYLHVKGIFRKSPAVSRLRQLEVSLSSGKTLEELQPPPHDVAGLVKSFLRSLPDPLFSEQIVSILVQCPSLLDKELRGIRLACTLLSPATLQCLQAVLSLLALVAQNYTDSRMNENSLAVVIAPTLFYNRNSLKKPMKEKATTQNIIRVIEMMLCNTKEIASVQVNGTADFKDRKRTGSLSDMFKVFPRKNFKIRTASQPYPVLFRDINASNKVVSGCLPGNLPVIKKSVRAKRPMEKYKPLLTEAKRTRLLEQSSTLREDIVRRQFQLKDTKLVRRNAFLLRRGIPVSGSDGYLIPKSADTTEIQKPEFVDSPKIAYPFENIRENLEFKFVSEDIEPAKILYFTKSPQKLKTLTQSEKTNLPPTDKQQQQQQQQQQQHLNTFEQTDSRYTTESVLTQEDTSGEMIRSRTEESLEMFASSLLNPDMQTNNSSFDSPPNFAKQPIRSHGVYRNTDNSSNTLPRPSMARRMNQQLNYFQCPENRVHINDKDVILPSSIHEIYISANGCSSTPIDMLESPFRVMSSLHTPADNEAISTRFGTVPLQRNIRLRDIPEATPVHPIDPYYTKQRLAQTELPDRTRPALQHIPSLPPSQEMATHSFSNSEISVGLTDTETPASFHRQNPIRRSFRKLLSPVVPMKREGERDSFDQNNERSRSNSNSNGSRKNRPQRRWSLRGMFKSPTPPRPVINTTVISSPIPIKLPYHPVFTQKAPGYKSVPPIVKRPCSKDTPPLDRTDLSPSCLIPAEVTPEYAEWFASPPSIISSEVSDMHSYAELYPHKHPLSKEDPFSPHSLLPHSNATATPSDNISEDFMRYDSFSDTSFDTSPYLLDEESPVIHFPFVEASIFAKPHSGAIKVLPDLPPLAPLKKTKPQVRPATLPRGSRSFHPECSLKEVDSEIEIDSRPVPANEVTKIEACIETTPLPDVSDCVKLFEAMARPSLGARRNPKARASFTSFDNPRNHSRLVKRGSMREPDRF